MGMVALILVCLACMCHGRMLHAKTDGLQGDLYEGLSKSPKADELQLSTAFARLLRTINGPAAGWQVSGHDHFSAANSLRPVARRARTVLATESASLSRRAALLGLATAALAPAAAHARPEGVNKPELLPSYQTNVIDLKKYLTSGELKKLDQKLTKLEEKTKYKVRVLTQSYPETPGSAIKDYWKVDGNSIIIVADKFTNSKGVDSNMLNINVGDEVKFVLPNTFWTQIRNSFGTIDYVKKNGEDNAILTTVEAIDYCLRNEEEGCADVPMMYKDPSKDMGTSKSQKDFDFFDAVPGGKKSSTAVGDFPTDLGGKKSSAAVGDFPKF